MHGYSKVDDNTFPNMLAVLTGQKVTVRQSELDGNPQTEFVDSWPFIWKNFSAAGYTTFLAEEQPGIFSYKGAGFRRPPTDVYLRPYGQMLNEDQTVTYKSSQYCYGNEPESALVLNNIQRFLELQKRSGTPFFALSFLWKVSHDLANSVEILDILLSDWLARIHQAGLLRDVMLFVMADHGNRFDKIR
ncbi:hypothetical protein AAVH_06983 [Aphelenchoides avenae]|nr:hypothetical protein AAVH_06983 [Aphelenchus avenae]